MSYYYGGRKISAETVRKVRAKCGLYQRNFAKRFGVSKRTIIRWEKDGTAYQHWESKRAKAWKALVKKYPRSFSKDEREAIRE